MAEVIKKGIVETKEALDLILTLGNAIGMSLEDGKLGLADLTNFLGVIYLVGPAIGNYKLIAGEIMDLDDAEKVDLYAFVQNKFDIPQDELELKIEIGLKCVIHLLDLVKLFQKKPEIKKVN